VLRKIISGAAVVALTAAALVATSSVAEARSARPALAAPASVTVGQSYAITVKPHRKGTVKLQRRAGNGAWHTVARKKARKSSGRLTFTRVESAAGQIAYRAKVSGHLSAVDRVSVKRKVSPPPPPKPQPELSVQVSTTSEDDILVDESYRVDLAATAADGSPIADLPVTVQKQDPGSSTWTPVGGSLTTDSDGEAFFNDSTSKRGFVTYRATGGSLTGETLAVIWENIHMPSAAGDGLSVGAPCGAGVSASGDDRDMTLTSAGTCHVAVNNVLTLTWNFGGNGCTEVDYDNFTFTGTAAEAMVDLSVLIDGTDTASGADSLTSGQSTGGLHLHGDPMSQLKLTMTVRAGANGSFQGRIAAPTAHCF
jgi:hypothetical protein